MKKLLAMLTLTTALVAAGGASAQTMDKNVKIGSLGDMSSLYADIGGQGSVVAAQMAVEDSGLLKEGWKIEVISADHQNKPDVGANIARQWIDVDKGDLGSHQLGLQRQHHSLGL
jgi:branched-chain amino acid transport system substrate-binding protein